VEVGGGTDLRQTSTNLHHPPLPALPQPAQPPPRGNARSTPESQLHIPVLPSARLARPAFQAEDQGQELRSVGITAGADRDSEACVRPDTPPCRRRNQELGAQLSSDRRPALYRSSGNCKRNTSLRARSKGEPQLTAEKRLPGECPRYAGAQLRHRKLLSCANGGRTHTRRQRRPAEEQPMQL
jgi:hypothetical protein